MLYFGHEKRWDKPLRLVDCFDIPEKFCPYVNDYRVNLFEIAYLPDEKVKMFKSDFGVVADYFVQMRKNGDYKPEPVQLHHVQEVLQLLSVMTGDRRFENAYHENGKGASSTMCEVLDRLEKKGENLIVALMQKLFAAGRIEDAQRAANDPQYREKLLAEFGLMR